MIALPKHSLAKKHAVHEVYRGYHEFTNGIEYFQIALSSRKCVAILNSGMTVAKRTTCAQAESERELTKVMARGQPQMILLVEDNAISRDVLADILREEGYGVMEATDGKEALTLLDTSDFDLIISDVLMPNLNGFDLLARVRLRWPNKPIILTSASMSQDQAKAILGGSAEFIEKPIDLSALFSTVQRLLPMARTIETVDVSGHSAR